MNEFLLVYLVAGILFTLLEQRSYDWEQMDDMPKAMIVLNVLHQLIHYSRFMLTWPWYILEDLLIIVGNKIFEGEEEDDDD